jgi:hypothetical protein
VGPSPDYVPDIWDGIHAGKRLIEGLRTLALLRMPRGPRTFHNSWPAYFHDWEDQLWQLEAEEEERRQNQREQNRTRLLPNSREIGQMETAIRWPGQYLHEFPQLLKVCGAVAFLRSKHRNIHDAARKLRLPLHLTRLWNRQGLDLIAAGLRSDRVQVF